MVRLEPLTVEQKESNAKSFNRSAKLNAYIERHLAMYLNLLQGRMKLTKKT